MILRIICSNAQVISLLGSGSGGAMQHFFLDKGFLFAYFFRKYGYCPIYVL